MSDVPRKIVWSTSLIALLTLSIGCGGATEKKYIPTTDVARGALEASLKMWKSGEKHGPVKGFPVPIDVYDARWPAGKKLQSYEILREEKTDGAKTFIVKMKVDGDKEETELKYLVVGKNPLMVFQEKDYKKASGTGG